MNYSNYLIESDDLTFPAIQEAINGLLLQGLDVRLTPVSRNRALIRRHILDAIEAQYNIDPWNYLKSKNLRFDKVEKISDEAALILLANRATAELDEQINIVVPPVNGVEWHLANIRAPQAWALLGGPDDIQWTCKVGQIDTGYTQHPALGFSGGASPWFLTAECKNFYSPDPNSSNHPGQPNGQDHGTGPNWGHGTRIGATISGWHRDGDDGKPFYGCAPKVPHVMARISNSVLINDQLDALANALNYLVDSAEVNVVSLSMGVVPPYLSSRAKQAVNNAYNKGVIFVCAGGQHVRPVIAPASYGRTIAVGGTTSKDQVWSEASIGKEIDWSAPAADIRRATLGKKPTGPFIYSNNGDGTSYATALTSGVAAMWLTHKGAAIAAAYPQPWMRVAAFKQIARSTARLPDPPTPWGQNVGGTGILNAVAVLNAPLPPATTLVQEAAL